MKYPIQAMVLSLLCALSFPDLAHGAVGKYDYIDQDLLINLYKKQCAANIEKLKSALREKNVKIKGTIKSAANSELLKCDFTSDEGLQILQSDDTLGPINAFIKKHGAKAYIASANENLETTLNDFGFYETLNKIKSREISQEDLEILSYLYKTKASTESIVAMLKNRSPETATLKSDEGTSSEAL